MKHLKNLLKFFFFSLKNKKVSISFDTKAPANQEFEILVIGDMIAVGPQPFSVVVLCGAVQKLNDTS